MHTDLDRWEKVSATMVSKTYDLRVRLINGDHDYLVHVSNSSVAVADIGTTISIGGQYSEIFKNHILEEAVQKLSFRPYGRNPKLNNSGTIISLRFLIKFEMINYNTFWIASLIFKG